MQPPGMDESEAEAPEAEEPETGGEEQGGGVTLEEHADSAIDAALAEHDPFPSTAEDEEEDEDEGEEEEAASGSAEGADDADEDDADESEEPEEDDLDTERDLEDLAIHKAYTTLHAQGVPAKVLKHTPKATLIAWAKRVEAQTSAGTAEKQALGDDEREGAKTGRAAKAGTAPDWAATRQGIADKLGIDEDAADAFKGLHDSLTAAQAELAEMRGQMVIDTNVRRLERKYPQLAEKPELVEKLTAKAHKLAASGGYESSRELFDDAAKLIKLDRDLAAKRRNGVSTPARLAGGYGQPAADLDEDFQRRMDLVEAGKFELARSLPPPRTQKKPGTRRPIG